jgi:hypothetical protein
MTKRRLGLPRLLARAHIREDSAQREVADRERAQTRNQEEYSARVEQLRTTAERQQLSAGARAAEEAAEAAAISAEELRQAQLRLYATARERKTLERLDDRDRAVLAVLAARASQRALDDLVSRKGRP